MEVVEVVGRSGGDRRSLRSIRYAGTPTYGVYDCVPRIRLCLASDDLRHCFAWRKIVGEATGLMGTLAEGASGSAWDTESRCVDATHLDVRPAMAACFRAGQR